MDANSPTESAAGAAGNCRPPAPLGLRAALIYSAGVVTCELFQGERKALRVHCWPAPSRTLWEVSVGSRGVTGDAEEVYPRDLLTGIFEQLGANPLSAFVAVEELEQLMAEATAPLELFRGGAGWLQPKDELMRAHCGKLTRMLKLS